MAGFSVSSDGLSHHCAAGAISLVQSTNLAAAPAAISLTRSVNLAKNIEQGHNLDPRIFSEQNFSVAPQVCGAFLYFYASFPGVRSRYRSLPLGYCTGAPLSGGFFSAVLWLVL